LPPKLVPPICPGPALSAQAMKIRVSLKVKANTEIDATLDCVTRPSETVASVKEKVTSAQLIPFLVDLMFNGMVLGDDSKLSACGVVEGSSLSLEIKATAATLAQQLVELLQARHLSPDELGLLYCYKYGASLKQAMELLGLEGNLEDFVGTQKCLSIENGLVTPFQADTTLNPFPVVEELMQILKASDSGTMDIKDLATQFHEKFDKKLACVVGCRPADFLYKQKQFEVHSRGLVSLRGARLAQMRATIRAPPGLEAPPDLGDETEEPAGAEQFLDLHKKIHSRSLNAQATQTLNDVVAAISDATFLDIDHVVIGGSIGKGAAISGEATAQVVLFLRGLPMNEQWLAPLLKAFAGSLDADFQAEHGIKSLCVTEDRLKMCVQGENPLSVDLYLSTAFDSYSQTLEVLGKQDPDVLSFYAPSFAKEQTQFVSRQPSSVKTTIRLMKWWRGQQQWYGRLSRPSDEILELAAIYSAVQTKPADQKEAIANLMSLLSRFGQMRVVWANYYSKDDVPGALLRQKPLLLDPTNPFVNVADPKVFDAAELMVLARTTHFFW